jgi:hypothetical protein
VHNSLIAMLRPYVSAVVVPSRILISCVTLRLILPPGAAARCAIRACRAFWSPSFMCGLSFGARLGIDYQRRLGLFLVGSLFLGVGTLAAASPRIAALPAGHWPSVERMFAMAPQ